jgi:acetolactate synthase-1/2/3 large subunit
MLKGADIIVKVLKDEGVKVVFGIPSIHNIGIYEALRKETSINHILCRNEASATHMADGYARAKNEIGVVITSTGPGAGYSIAPLLEAFGSLSPVIMITTNIPNEKIGKGLGVLHEIEEQSSIFKPFTKAQLCIRSREEIERLTKMAIRTAVYGRPGPVYLEIPSDLLDADLSMEDISCPESEEKEDGSYNIEGAIDMLLEARQPLILAGTSAIRAGLGDEIKLLAERLWAPVVTVTQAKGIIPEDHPLSFGNAARKGKVREMIEKSDMVIAIGTRLREVDARRRGLILPRLIHLDWDERWMGKNFQTELPLAGDIKKLVRRIIDSIPREISLEERMERVSAMKRGLEEERERIKASHIELEYLDRIRHILPRDGVLVIDNTQLAYWAEYFFPSYGPGNLIAAKGTSIIGFSFPATIGVKMAIGERAVVAITGDGGFLYGAQELATCMRHRIGFPVIVVNDSSYGVIGYLQRLFYGKEYESWLTNPDFVKLAKSFGANGVKVDSPDTLSFALEKALVSGEMWIIELIASFPEPPFGKY